MQTQTIDFHPPSEAVASFLLPVATKLFAERADRFAVLAVGNPLGDWLAFLGQLSLAQHAALQALPDLPLPAAATLDLARTHGMPPLAADQRPAVWRDVLHGIADRLRLHAPAAARGELDALLVASDDCLEAMADSLLAGEPKPGQGGRLPFVAAALQVVHTRLASQFDAGRLQPLDVHGVCPCCGSPPVASIVRLGAAINNLRYLHCSLCNTEWNVPRATCTACGTDRGVALQQLDGAHGAVRAETCDSCKSYLKIVYQEKDALVDPVADDLATLALDILVDEAGYQRAGPNLLLLGAHN